MEMRRPVPRMLVDYVRIDQVREAAADLVQTIKVIRN
jgi:hypothetical protein